jgi:hypothetical protein
LLMPLFEEDGLRQGELGRRARLSKQTMTTIVHAGCTGEVAGEGRRVRGGSW